MKQYKIMMRLFNLVKVLM